MPDISLPEVRFPKIELPEGLRDMTREDIQNALPDFKLPDFGKQANKMADQAGKYADQAGKQAGKYADQAGKQAEKFADKAGKEVGKFADDVASNIEQALPRRSGPSPVPFAALAMAGGLVVGWILATSPTTAPKINSFMDWVRARIDDWRNRGLTDLDDDLDSGTNELRSFSAGLGSDAYAGAGSTSAMNVDPGQETGLEGESWSGTTSPDTFKGQSLGAAATDDFDPDPLITDEVVVEEVIVVDADGSATTAAGTGRMTDQMPVDDTEGDDDLPTGDARLVEEPLGGGRLTETMKIDDTDETTDDAPFQSPSTDRF